MERNDSSSRLVMKDDLNALTKTVITLAQSVADYVYEMGEHDVDVYDARGEIFEEDVDYTAQGEDCHYSPMLEDEIANYYNSPQLQSQQERVKFYADAKPSSSHKHYNDSIQSINQYQGVDHLIGQYSDNASSNLNFYSRQGDEEQEEPTLAQIMSQMMEMQAQQEKDFQFLTSELQQEKAARKMLETQLAQQASNSYENPEKSPSQHDVSSVDPNTITLKSDEVLEEPKGTDKASTEVFEEDVQEHVKEKEVVEQETPCVAPPAYIPPIPFPPPQIKVHVETIDGDKVINVCKLTFDEREVLSNKHAKSNDTVGNNLNEVMKKSFHEGPEILICNTRLKDETTMSLPGH